jgi:uncharacterized membrane protein
MTLADLAEVWTGPSALFAIASGVLFGVAVGWISINPNYSAGVASAVRIGAIAFMFAASGGLTFYAGQALGSYLSDDPSWYRVLSRYGQWIVFSLAIGVTTWFLIHRDRGARRRRAHERITGYSGAGDH